MLKQQANGRFRRIKYSVTVKYKRGNEMYKLFITTDNGKYILTGIGNDITNLKKFGENWIESHGYTLTSAKIDIINISPHYTGTAESTIYKSIVPPM